MNRITNLFQTQKDGILSVYFTAGYPNLNDTASILKALQAKGIHMVEVGIPFSDPMADGPVIQEAATQALRKRQADPEEGLRYWLMLRESASCSSASI